ncbi:unnamed protein product [Calicophoron daubneyi]|uniref:Guided entry of tail-anchored proteins factor 1 n=1 Tax=Calicophoron daubneyi TaxID=300641 RepID=A0AAV2TCQ9_CALDB
MDNSMDQQDYLDLWSSDQNPWLHHLVTVFLVSLLFRLLRVLGVVGKLHSALVFLLTVSTSAGRKRRADRSRLAAELRQMKSQLTEMSMMNNFAAYSKLERRIRATKRQWDQLSPETFEQSIKRVVGINVFLFIIEGLAMGWLVTHSPKETVTKRDLADASQRGSHFILVLNFLYYIPTKLVTAVWVLLSHAATQLVANWSAGLLAGRKELTPPNASPTEIAGDKTE